MLLLQLLDLVGLLGLFGDLHGFYLQRDAGDLGGHRFREAAHPVEVGGGHRERDFHLGLGVGDRLQAIRVVAVGVVAADAEPVGLDLHQAVLDVEADGQAADVAHQLQVRVDPRQHRIEGRGIAPRGQGFQGGQVFDHARGGLVVGGGFLLVVGEEGQQPLQPPLFQLEEDVDVVDDGVVVELLDLHHQLVEETVLQIVEANFEVRPRSRIGELAKGLSNRKELSVQC